MFRSSTSTASPLEPWCSPPSTRRSASTTPVCRDEYQQAPQILDAPTARLNREGGRPGTAVLAGSTRQDALPALPGP